MIMFCNLLIHIVENKTKLFQQRLNNLNMTISLRSFKKVARLKALSRFIWDTNRGHYLHSKKVLILKFKLFLVTISPHETFTKSLAKSIFSNLNEQAKAFRPLQLLRTVTSANIKTTNSLI